MISVFQYIWWGGDPDHVDSVTGLSRRDVHVIKKSWERLHADPISTGMMLFVKLFRAAPATKNYFKAIKGLPEEEFTRKAQFKAHVLNFMTYLNMVVTSIQEPDIVIPLMQKLGVSHRRFDVQPEHFHVLTEVLVDTLKNSLHASDDAIASWSRFITFIYTPMFETFSSPD